MIVLSKARSQGLKRPVAYFSIWSFVAMFYLYARLFVEQNIKNGEFFVSYMTVFFFIWMWRDLRKTSG